MKPKLSLINVITFLSQNGWFKAFELRDAFQVWHSHEFSNSEVTLPLNENHKRYDMLLSETLDELSENLRLSKTTLIKHISPASYDSIMVRAIAEDVDDGTIPFEDGMKLLRSSFNLLKNCSTKIEKFKHKNKHLNNYFNDICMGQTKIGSYIVTIKSPLYRVESNDEPKLFDSDLSLGRRITTIFYHKLFEISEIFSNESNADIIIKKLLKLNIDKMDCDALIDIFGFKSHRDIEIKFNWSAKEPVAEKYNNSISLRSNDIQKIIDYRECLKTKNSQPNIELSGEIADLHRDYNDETGRARLKTKYQEREISVIFNVNEELYSEIANAHVNKKSVTLTGELETMKINNKITANFKSLTKWVVCENIEIPFLNK